MTPSELNAFLKRNKMTANELAAKLGVHWTTISRWRNGHEHIPRAVELACKWLEMEGRAALQSQDREGYAGVTVWMDGAQCTKIITRIQYESSSADELLRHFEAARAAIDHAMKIEG